MLAALENNDLSKLPGGIYRLALLTAYAKAIGLPPEAVLADFSRLFPTSGDSAYERSAGGMRLTMEPDSRWTTRSVLRMLSAVADTCAVFFLGGVVSQFTGANPWIVGGALGLVYHAVSTALLGRSPASWYAHRVMFLRETQQAHSLASEHASATTPN